MKKQGKEKARVGNNERKGKEKKRRKERGRKACVERSSSHLQSLQVQAINILLSRKGREGEEDATRKSLYQLQAENYNEDEVLFTDLGIIWKFIKSSTSYQAVKEDKKGGLYYPNAPIKGKVNGWIRATGIGAKEDGLRMTETEKDKRKERLEKNQARRAARDTAAARRCRKLQRKQSRAERTEGTLWRRKRWQELSRLPELPERQRKREALVGNPQCERMVTKACGWQSHSLWQEGTMVFRWSVLSF